MPEKSVELGSKNTRIEVSSRLWELLEEVAKVMDATPKWCLQTLLRRVENMAVTGQIDALGFEFAQAVKQLNNRGRLYDDGVPEADVSKLHRSERAKSGFVGVYSNGKGFRAEGKDGTGGLITLGTFPSAESAAWARYRHYMRTGLSYGVLEELIDKMKREEGANGRTDKQIKHDVIWTHANLLHSPVEGLSPEDRELENIDPITAPGGDRSP
jgi:hypothetical protein